MGLITHWLFFHNGRRKVRVTVKEHQHDPRINHVIERTKRSISFTPYATVDNRAVLLLSGESMHATPVWTSSRQYMSSNSAKHAAEQHLVEMMTTMLGRIPEGP